MLSCSDSDSIDPIEFSDNDRFVFTISTGTGPGAGGVLISLDSLPSGDFDPNSISNSLAISNTRTTGFAYKNALYGSNNFAGDEGIHKLASDEMGLLEEAGFISGSDGFEIINDSKGYYTNSDINPKALQVFDPSNMVRTGEIDLSSQIETYMKTEVENAWLGGFIKQSNGYLYTSIEFADANWNSVYDSTFVLVLNVENDQFIDWAIYPEHYKLGHAAGYQSARFVGAANDGYLYMANIFVNDRFLNPVILRIRGGETEFDQNFKFSFNKAIGGATHIVGGSVYANGALYSVTINEPVASDFSNMSGIDNRYAFKIDVASQSMQRIEDIPLSEGGMGPFLYDGKIYFSLKHVNTDKSTVYSYNPSTGNTETLFNLTFGTIVDMYVLSD